MRLHPRWGIYFMKNGIPPPGLCRAFYRAKVLADNSWNSVLRPKGGVDVAERTTSVLHEDKKEIVKRLSRALGHLRHVKQMVEEEQDCPDVLIQLAAVNGALGGTGKEILAYCLDE